MDRPEPKIKRIKYRRKFIALTKDGFIVGKRKAGRKRHVTFLEKDGRITIHKTDEGEHRERKNVFSAEKEEVEKEYGEFEKLLFSKSFKHRKPKFIYSVTNSYLAEYLAGLHKIKGREVCLEPPNFSENLVRISYDEFLNGEYAIGVTKAGTLVVKTPDGCRITTKKTMLEIRHLPLFRALDKARAS